MYDAVAQTSYNVGLPLSRDRELSLYPDRTTSGRGERGGQVGVAFAQQTARHADVPALVRTDHERRAGCYPDPLTGQSHHRGRLVFYWNPEVDAVAAARLDAVFGERVDQRGSPSRVLGA